MWPETFDEGNPFGGVDGVRPIRITFHNSSFANLENDEKKTLKILIGNERADAEIIGLKIIDEEGETIIFSGVSTSCLKSDYIGYLLGIYSFNEEEKYRSIRQEILEAKSHGALRRDIFITSSTFLLKNRDKLDKLNICTPRDALKITGLYLRMKGEFEWISHVKCKTRFITSSQNFYQFLSRGLLPCSWKYLSGLWLLNKHKILISLGWSVLHRYSRVLQARDEIGRLFYMPNTFSSKDQMEYHFDYFTILLTAALDVQALIINKVFSLGLKDNDCGLRRGNFKKEVNKNSATSNLNTLLADKEDFINILFDLRNKIHSISLETSFHVPEAYPDELLERIYQHDKSDHLGIQKENVTVIENRGDPVPSIDYSVDIYNLAHGLVNEATNLINSLMEETKIEGYLDAKYLSKILLIPPDDMLPFIQTYLFLA